MFRIETELSHTSISKSDVACLDNAHIKVTVTILSFCVSGLHPNSTNYRQRLSFPHL